MRQQRAHGMWTSNGLGQALKVVTPLWARLEHGDELEDLQGPFHF